MRNEGWVGISFIPHPSSLIPSANEFGQKGRQQNGAAGLQQGLLQGTLQLSDVSWPGVVAQPLQSLRGDLANLASKLTADALQIVPHEHRQVVAAFTQRGQVDGEDTQSVIQVG